MKLNKEWHLTHPMPKNPTMEQIERRNKEKKNKELSI
jgi:hypothetical protein